ncbi:MAG: hypothetical protein H0T79_21030 [Deltaproteobacteria bacterium]|nr:hypothetical protein [Deltaproteobacteria bacterium]
MKTLSCALPLSLSLFAVGCAADLDEQWDLDHDRIIAVRATKPGLLPGEQTELIGLIGRDGDKTFEQVPQIAGVVMPMSLAGAVTFDRGQWLVTAPSAEQIDAARTELGIPAGMPVPLTVGLSYAEGDKLAVTTVRLGVDGVNPVIGSPMVDGKPAAPGVELVVDSLVDVRLSVTLAEKLEVNWLTSCGQMHDFDLPEAYLRVEQDDPTEGELAVVVRDRLGGVDWMVWPIRANPIATEL